MNAARTWLLPFGWGLVSGLPLALTTTVLQAWLTTEGYSMETVGLASVIGLPYSLKMLWAPALDRPMPLARLGLRRSWLLALQLMLAIAFAAVTVQGLSHGPALLAATMLVVVVLSASQDVVIDAWRAERFEGADQPRAAAAYVSAYRIAMWLCAGLGLVVAQWLGFRALYGAAAIAVLVSAACTWYTQDPSTPSTAHVGWGQIVQPWRELWVRRGIGLVLALALLYKLGDAMAAALVTPFLLQRGYTLADIGLVAQGVGLWATIGGSLVGGWVLGRMSLMRGLWLGGILQALSTVGYVLLAGSEPDVIKLTLVVCTENATAGLGTAAFLSWLAAQAQQPYTATQYAVLSALAAVPRTVLAGSSGVLQATLGWPLYFTLCVAAAMPGLVALWLWQRGELRARARL